MTQHRASPAADDRAPTRATPVPSPCISVCRIDPSDGLCEGCLRTLDEIARWGSMNDDARHAVWKALDERRVRRDAASKTTNRPRTFDAGS